MNERLPHMTMYRMSLDADVSTNKQKNHEQFGSRKLKCETVNDDGLQRMPINGKSSFNFCPGELT